MPNEIKVVVATKGDVGKMADDAKKSGKEIGDSLQKGFDTAEKASTSATTKINANFARSAKQIGDSLDKIESEAWESGKGMDEAFTRSLKALRENLDRVRTDAGRTGKGLESDLGGALLKVRKDMERLGDQAKDTGKEIKKAVQEGVQDGGGGLDLGEMFSGQMSGGFDIGGLLEGLGGGAGGAWATAGAAAGALFAEESFRAAEAFWDTRSMGGLISAKNDGTASEGRRLGEIAGESFYDGFGASIEGAGESLSAVVGNSLADMDAPEEELRRLTDMASTASQVVGEEANQIARAAKQLLVTGLAGNAEEAIDIIVTASQRGVNVSDDLIDTIVEYGTKFRDLGLSGEQALGLISQAMQAGARDSDFAADALSEFVNIAGKASPAASRAFQAMGLDAETMMNKIAGGGDGAREALRLTLNGLQGISDAATRDQAAFDLFGPKAEDLGESLYSMDLDTVADQMGNVEGATDRAAATIEGSRSPVDKLSRSWSEFTNSAIGGLMLIAEGAPRSMGKAAGNAKDLGFAVDESGDAADGATDKWAHHVETLDEVISRTQEAAGIILGLSDAQIGYEEAIDNASEALEKNGANLDIGTEAGRENKKALDDIADSTWNVVEAMKEQGASSEEVSAFVQRSRDEFVSHAIALGMDATAANTLADRLGLVPGDYKANVEANTGNALRKVRDVEDALGDIAGTWVVNVAAVGSGLGLAHRAAGGPASAAQLGAVYSSGIPHAASGGARGSTFIAHEQGPEIVEHPDGSMVIPHGMSEMLMQGWAGGGGQRRVVELRPDGSVLSAWMMQTLREAVRDEGGDVQLVLGST